MQFGGGTQPSALSSMHAAEWSLCLRTREAALLADSSQGGWHRPWGELEGGGVAAAGG